MYEDENDDIDIRDLPHIDASVGDPVIAFNDAAKYALEKSMGVMNLYDNYGRYSHDMLRTISEYFNETLKMKRPGWTGVGLDCFAYTNGITEGYNYAIEQLALKAGKLNTYYEEDLKPAIIMPVPTYGIFFDNIHKNGIDIIKLPRESDGSVCPKKLHNLMIDTYKAGKQRIVGYYDSNPNNPTGHIRNAAETRALAKVFTRHNEYWRHQQFKFCQEHQKKRHDPSMASTITVIDDLAYIGTEMSRRQTSSFMSIEEMFKDTIVLAGGSKIGLTALRTGCMIADSDFIYGFQKAAKLKQYFPSTMAMHALSVAFPEKEDLVNMRQKHLKKLNRQHKFSGKLMKALINGVKDTDATDAEYKRMVNIVMRTRKMPQNDAEALLHYGVKGVRVTTSPQSGFFHLLDYSDIKGHRYKDHNSFYYDNEDKILESEEQLEKLHGYANMKFCSGTHSGLTPDDMVVRTTFAMKPAEIVKTVQRIEMMMDQLVLPPKAEEKQPKHSL